jgi:sugar O-acyltransferase (sialic acid O-acetyltransferase NeuD family)
MAKVIIFGVEDFASLAHFYLKNDSQHEIVAFSVSKNFLPGTQKFEGLPIVPFEDIEKSYSPSDYYFFAPMSYRKMNRLRSQIYEDVKDKGYKMINYISSSAIIAPGTKIGDNCFFLENVVVQPFVSIGNNVMIWSGSQISHHSSIKDHVFFGAHVAVSGHCTVDSYSFLGINSTLKERTHFREGGLLAMSAAVTGDTEPWSIYQGIPAKKTSASSRDFDI